MAGTPIEVPTAVNTTHTIGLDTAVTARGSRLERVTGFILYLVGQVGSPFRSKPVTKYKRQLLKLNMSSCTELTEIKLWMFIIVSCKLTNCKL